MSLIKIIVYISLLASTLAVAGQEQKLELYLETGHSGSISYVGFSADGAILVSKDNGTDSAARIWDFQTGAELKAFECTRAVLSPGGETLLTAFFGVIKLWDLKTGAELMSLKGHKSPVAAISFSTDKKTIFSASMTEIKTWDAASGKEIKTISAAETNLDFLAFSSDNQTLAAIDLSNNLKLVNAATGKTVKTFKGHTHRVNSAAFSKSGKTLASGSVDGSVKLWDAGNGRMLKSIDDGDQISSVAFSPDERRLIYGGDDYEIVVWDIASEKKIKTLKGHTGVVTSLAYSADGRFIVSGDTDDNGIIWDAQSGEQLKNLNSNVEAIKSLAFAQSGAKLVSETFGGKIKLWDFGSQTKLTTFEGKSGIFSPDGKWLVRAADDVNDNRVALLDTATGKETKFVSGHLGGVEHVAFSPDNKLLATGGRDGDIKIWNAVSREELRTLKGHTDDIGFLHFSPDGSRLASTSDDKALKIWEVATGKLLHSFANEADNSTSLLFAQTDKLLLAITTFEELRIRDAGSGELLNSSKLLDPQNPASVYEVWERTVQNRRNQEPQTADGRFKVKKDDNGKIDLFDAKTNKLLAGVVAFGEDEWIISTPEGRFDTNKSLDRIEDLHWIVNDEILKPLPLDVFMRQYYEPGLLQRVLKCTRENTCEQEFKPLPSIADINRVQPKVVIKEIKFVADSSNLADVIIEVENVTENFSISATNPTKKIQKTSGAFDLRLFRDGQLVGVSAPKKDLDDLIKSAPALAEKDKLAKTLVNTEEDKQWRKTNDIFKLTGENVKVIAKDRILQYTFRNVKIPRDGRKEAEFTAYAFNADKVKSTTTAPFKFNVPDVIADSPRKPRAFIVSIGVNASENPAYNLRYAVNDADETIKIVGKRLEAESEKYAEVVKIALLSDYDENKNVTKMTAQKPIIKGVFALLAGKSYKDILAEMTKENSAAAELFKSLPNVENLPAVEPEDTLIITFSGHGYADNAGIFYLLPYDIGKNTAKLTAETLQKTISSDELSLWMQDVTASEMIFIIDACHSSAAVQGAGFKPGPMGSRGLGQLAYDKDMKILSATQADNVALELRSLRQGLLSYALLQDGIIGGLADAPPNDKKLSSAEWLVYAEKRVPQLYQEVRDGKRSIEINGEIVNAESKKSEIIYLDDDQNSSLNLQQPTLFDFKRRKQEKSLFVLP